MTDGNREWRDGWPLVLSSAGGMFLGAISIYSAGVFVVPLEQAYGWSRSQISLGLTIFLLLTVLGTPMVGAMVDRFGPRRVGLPGAALYLAAVGLLGFAGPGIAGWYLLWVLVAVLALGSKPNIYAAAVTSRFDRHRGVALGATLTGASIATGVMPGLAEFCINQFGLRLSFLAMAGITAIITLPLLWAFFYGAQDKNGAAPAPQTAERVEAKHPPAIGHAVRSPAFFKLAFASFAIAATLPAMGTMLVPLFISKDIEPSTAASIMIIMGITSVIGRFVGGWLMDNFNPIVPGSLIFLLPIVAFLLSLQLDGSVVTAAIILIIMGFCLGAEVDVIAYLASRLFAPEQFGRIFGLLISLLAFGAASGAQLGSGIFDMTGSYDLMLYIAIPLVAASAAALATLPKIARPRRVEPGPEMRKNSQTIEIA